MKNAHTQELWRTKLVHYSGQDRAFVCHIGTSEGPTCIAVAQTADVCGERAFRIMEEHNACAGMNPAALAECVELFDQLINSLRRQSGQYSPEDVLCDKARAALAKLKGQA